mmetsp:Transcript_21701/g.41449  ORF Transcript_21701/g.41449 Transcript_21701/m.41449 type:complete len:267 (-) Transcript_21701:81-881(-)
MLTIPIHARTEARFGAAPIRTRSYLAPISLPVQSVPCVVQLRGLLLMAGYLVQLTAFVKLREKIVSTSWLYGCMPLDALALGPVAVVAAPPVGDVLIVHAQINRHRYVTPNLVLCNPATRVDSVRPPQRAEHRSRKHHPPAPVDEPVLVVRRAGVQLISTHALLLIQQKLFQHARIHHGIVVDDENEIRQPDRGSCAQHHGQRRKGQLLSTPPAFRLVKPCFARHVRLHGITQPCAVGGHVVRCEVAQGHVLPQSAPLSFHELRVL